MAVAAAVSASDAGVLARNAFLPFKNKYVADQAMITMTLLE